MTSSAQNEALRSDPNAIPEIGSEYKDTFFKPFEWQEIESRAWEFGSLVGGSLNQFKVRGPIISTTVWHGKLRRHEHIIAESSSLTSLFAHVHTMVKNSSGNNKREKQLEQQASIPLDVTVARNVGKLALTSLGAVTACATEIYPAIGMGNPLMLGLGLGTIAISTLAGAITDSRRRHGRLKGYAKRFNEAISIKGIQDPLRSAFVMKYQSKDENKILAVYRPDVVEQGGSLDYFSGYDKGIVTKTEKVPDRRFLQINFSKWFDASVFSRPAPKNEATFIKSWNGTLGQTVKSILPIMDRLTMTEKKLEKTDYFKSIERKLLEGEIEALANEIGSIIVDYEASREHTEGVRGVKKTAEAITSRIINLEEQARMHDDTNAYTRGIAHVTAMVARAFWALKPHPIAKPYQYTSTIEHLFDRADEALQLVRDPDDSEEGRAYDPDSVVQLFHKTIAECIDDYFNATNKKSLKLSELKNYDRFYALYFDKWGASYKLSPDSGSDDAWPIMYPHLS